MNLCENQAPSVIFNPTCSVPRGTGSVHSRGTRHTEGRHRTHTGKDGTQNFAPLSNQETASGRPNRGKRHYGPPPLPVTEETGQ